jgi:hypothetical protein
MKLQIKGKDYKIDLARFDKISDGVYLLRIEFSEPKYFECLAGAGYDDNKLVYEIDIFPRFRETNSYGNVINMRFIPETEFEPDEEYRMFCEGTRYVLDVLFVRKDLLDKELREVSIISL